MCVTLQQNTNWCHAVTVRVPANPQFPKGEKNTRASYPVDCQVGPSLYSAVPAGPGRHRRSAFVHCNLQLHAPSVPNYLRAATQKLSAAPLNF